MAKWNESPRVTENLGDCRKRSYRIAPDFGLAARRDGGSIAGYAAVGATPKPGQKTSKQVFSLTEIALSQSGGLVAPRNSFPWATL